MKRKAIVVSLVTVLVVATGSWAVDRAAISSNVDKIVAAIDSGKDVTAFKADAYEPYVFIMEEQGKLLVHPTLSGQSLKEKAPPAYAALMQANPQGTWVKYEWQDKEKNTYAKRTNTNLIVGSGY